MFCIYIMLTDLYLQTTNPKLSFKQFLSPQILTGIFFSVIFHTIIYTAFFNLGSYIFYGKRLVNEVNVRLVIALLIIMFFGFFARFLHVKEIYKAYNYNIERTRNHLDKLYIGWIFVS
jgi:hypothetical protein